MKTDNEVEWPMFSEIDEFNFVLLSGISPDSYSNGLRQHLYLFLPYKANLLP